MDAMKGLMVTADKELAMDDVLKALTEADVEVPEGPAPLPPMTLGTAVCTHIHAHKLYSLLTLHSCVFRRRITRNRL